MKSHLARTPLASLLWAPVLVAVGASSHAAPSVPGLSQGETISTPLCVDTGHARITRLCANVVLRYKIDALLDAPLSNFGLTWSPTSWTFSQLDGSQHTIPQDKLPAPLAHILAGTALQLKGHALVDFTANAPLQFLPYQTNLAPARDRLAWTAAQRSPQARWLFTPGKCGDGPIQSTEASQALALYKLGVKSLSVDPRKGAATCKAQIPTVTLDMAAKTLDKLCLAETSRPQANTPSGLCLPPTAAGIPPKANDNDGLRQRWGTQLDEGIPSVMARPSLALLESAEQAGPAAPLHPSPAPITPSN